MKLDRTSSFSVRAPEYAAFNEVRKYAKFFSRKKTQKKDNDLYGNRVDEMPIKDGCGYTTLFRPHILHEARNYLEDKLSRCRVFPNEENLNAGQCFVAKEILKDILIPLCNMGENELKQSDLAKKFVDLQCNKPSIIVCTPVSPMSPMFTYSRIISEGKFTCEMDIFNTHDIRSAYLECKMIGEYNKEESDKLIVKYWKNELLFLPIARGLMNVYIHESAMAIENLILHNNDILSSTPYVLLKQIETYCNEEFDILMIERRNNLVKVLSEIGIPNFPDMETLINQRRNNSMVWNPLLPRPGLDQTQESFEEQNRVINNCKTTIEKLFNKERYVHPNSILIVGSPGVGKTWVMSTLVMYSLTLGLNVCVTALTAQRARELGGVHIHELFCLRPNDHNTVSTDLQSEKGIIRLILNNPMNLEYLRRLDILFIDEIGLLSREFMVVLDNVLKSIRKNSVVFGGLVLICTGDYCQLAPVTGKDIWFSFYMFVSFKVFELKSMVRSRNDETLQTVIKVLRKPEITDTDKAIVMNIFEELLNAEGKVVDTFEKAPENYIKLLSKKVGVKTALKCLNDAREKKIEDENKKRHPPQRLIAIAKFLSKDEMETNLGNFIDATEDVIKQLNKTIREPEILTVTEEQLLRFTVNSNNFSQGQVCKVKNIIFNGNEAEALEVLIAKPGTMEFDEGSKIHHIKPIYTRTIDIQRPWVKARRKQLPLDNADVTTIHKAIGQTHLGVATKISLSDEAYHLWERPMFLVIVSRVRRLEDLLFVGEKNDIMNCIDNVLNMKCEKWKIIENMIKAKDSANEIIPYEVFTGHGEEFYLPGIHSSGYIYTLVSLKNRNERYVGHTKDLQKELNDINNDLKVIGKSAALKKWVVMGFISGVNVEKIGDYCGGESENELFRHMCNISNYTGVSADYMEKVEVEIRKWNERINRPFSVSLVWCCGKEWFLDIRE